jgi:hypothetical protein
LKGEAMTKTHDLIRQIIDTANAIAERAAAIPVGDDPPYRLEIELAVAVDRMEEVETTLDNLTEDDTR